MFYFATLNTNAFMTSVIFLGGALPFFLVYMQSNEGCSKFKPGPWIIENP